MNPIKTVQRAVDMHNHSRQLGPIKYRNRVSLFRAGWGRYWGAFAVPAGCILRDANTERHVHIPLNSAVDIHYGGYYDTPQHTIDFAQRKFVTAPHAWTMSKWLAIVMLRAGIWPGDFYPRYTYADRYNAGGMFIWLGAHGMWRHAGLSIQYDESGSIVDVQGDRVRWYTPNKDTAAYTKRLFHKLRDTLHPWECLRNTAPDAVRSAYFNEIAADELAAKYCSANLPALLDEGYSLELHASVLHYAGYGARYQLTGNQFERALTKAVHRYMAATHGVPL